MDVPPDVSRQGSTSSACSDCVPLPRNRKSRGGHNPSQICRAATRSRARSLLEWSCPMTVLADKIDGVIGVDPIATPWPLPSGTRSAACSPRPLSPPPPLATSVRWPSPTPVSSAGDAGRWRRGQLRAGLVAVLLAPGGAGAGSGPAQASTTPQRSEHRRARPDPRRTGGAHARPYGRTYAARRRSEGKTSREIRRCVKRAVARQLFKLLEAYDRPGVEVVRIT
jgi:hypothetical protein